MKKTVLLKLSAVILFIAAVASVTGLLGTYTQTDKEPLFLTPTFDDSNGWEFYVTDSGQRKQIDTEELLETKGTFYISRTLTQDLEDGGYTSLLLTGNIPCAVFVDGNLIYTNYPNENLQFDNVDFGGYASALTRGEVKCTLPNQLAGSNLTIATAHGKSPCMPGVKLSSQAIDDEMIVAAANREMIPASAFAVMALLLLGIWIFAFFQGIRAPQALLLIITALLQMFYRLRAYEFVSSAPTALATPFTMFIPVLGLLLPLVWLLLQMKKKQNRIIFGVILGISAVTAFIMPVGAVFGGLPFYSSFLANNDILYLPIAALIVFAALEAGNKNIDFRLLLPGMGVAVLFGFINGFPFSILDWCAEGLFALTALISLYKVIKRVIQIHTDLATQTERSKQLDIRLLAQRDFYAAKLTSENEIRSLRHDMDGHIKTLQALLGDSKTEEAKKYIDGIAKQRSEQTVKIFSDNPYINAVLNNYDAICRKHYIDFSCRIGIDNRELPATELCLILNNALENAVEASLTLPEKNREIKVQIAVKQNRFLLRVSNRFDGDIKTDHGLPVTKKDGNEHGYGLSNIRAAAERKGGSMEYFARDGYFVLDVEFAIDGE